MLLFWHKPAALWEGEVRRGASGRKLKKKGRKTLILRVFKELNSATTILEADFLKVKLEIKYLT